MLKTKPKPEPAPNGKGKGQGKSSKGKGPTGQFGDLTQARATSKENAIMEATGGRVPAHLTFSGKGDWQWAFDI